jgi:hypothetical protein
MFPADTLAEFRLVMERLDASPDSGASGCRALQESVLEAASDLLKRSLRSFSPPADSTRSVARRLARERACMLIDQLRPATLEEISIPEVPRLGHSAVCRRGRSLEPLQMPMEIASEPELSESLQNQVNAPHGGIERELSRHTHLFRGSQKWLVSKLTEAAGPEVESVAFRFPEAQRRSVRFVAAGAAASESATGRQTVHVDERSEKPRVSNRQAKRTRSAEVHAECDSALECLGWSQHDWADQTLGKVSRSAVDRIFSGETRRIRAATRRELVDALEAGLKERGRLDLLMRSSRWADPLERVPGVSEESTTRHLRAKS